MQWMEDGARIEELESEGEGGWEVGGGHHHDINPLLLDDRHQYARQVNRGNVDGRRDRRTIHNMHYDEYADETESVANGLDFDLFDNTDSTVAYAVQLAMRDKEEEMIEKVLERIRRARMLGKQNVRLSQRELDVMERRRMRMGEVPKDVGRRASGSKDKPAKESRRTRSDSKVSSKAKGRPSGFNNPFAHPQVPDISPQARATGASANPHVASGVRPSSSSSQRPRTPSTQPHHSQSAHSSPRPLFPQQVVTDRYPLMPGTRPRSSSSRSQAHHRILPDDPRWIPPPALMQQPLYAPYPIDPHGLPVPMTAHRPTARPPPDERYSSSASTLYSVRRAPADLYTEESSSYDDEEDEDYKEEEEEESDEEEAEDDGTSEDDSDDPVQFVKVVPQKPQSAPATRQASGGSLGRRSQQRSSARRRA